MLSHLDVSLAEEHLHRLLHDGQQASVMHSNASAHQVTQTHYLQQQQQQQHNLFTATTASHNTTTGNNRRTLDTDTARDSSNCGSSEEHKPWQRLYLRQLSVSLSEP